MNTIHLADLLKSAIHYHLKVTPGTHVRVTRGDRWIFKSTDEYLKDYDARKGSRSFNRKMQLVRANKHREALLYQTRKDNFDLKAGNYIMAFMKHMPKSWKKGKRKPGKRDQMAWQPMTCRPDVDNFFKKTADSLLREDSEIWCAAMLKFWIPDEIPEGTYFINVPEFFQFIVQYLKEKLVSDHVFT
jgi:Holliday junction resolvase RusA-like endonuclease